MPAIHLDGLAIIKLDEFRYWINHDKIRRDSLDFPAVSQETYPKLVLWRFIEFLDGKDLDLTTKSKLGYSSIPLLLLNLTTLVYKYDNFSYYF
jgi:hypothetical protein